jgi:putative transposase
MQLATMRYARHRHRALRTSGHLFERRYKARLVERDDYFLTLLRYIHLNPLTARLVTDPVHYQWSSHRIYLGHESPRWVTTDFGLSLFHTDPSLARVAYARFIGQYAADPTGLALTGGGVTTDPTAFKDAPLPTMPATASQRQHNAPTLEELANRICPGHHVSVSWLRSLSRARELTPIRVDFITQAIDLRIATLTELARFLNRDPSALTKLLARHRPAPQIHP